MKKRTPFTLAQTLPYLLLLTGTFGLLASSILTHDTLQVMQNPDFVPACNINPILSCGSVMKSEQASMFGPPNSVLGIVAFSALITFSLLLATGVVMKKWIWRTVQAVATLGVLFMHYLFFQAVFVLNTICPWCFGIWMITIPVFWYITLYNLRMKNIRVSATLSPFVAFLQQKHAVILAFWYFAILGVLLWRFWDYWVTLL